MSEPTSPEPTQPERAGASRFRLWALIVVALVAGVLVWLAVRDSSGSSTSSGSIEAKAVTIGEIQALVDSIRHPIYWAGPREGYTYELAQSSDGSIFIRYLPPGAEVGTKDAYLTVATYPFAGAFDALKAVASKGDSTAIALPNKGLAGVSAGNPTSVHVAYPGVNYQVEVFDPARNAATALVKAGKVTAFGSEQAPTTANQPTAVSRAKLRALAASLGHPIYWAGPKAGFTYELTETANGDTHIRYLPPGETAGSSERYLTVGTYQYPHAFEAIQGLAKSPDADVIKLAGGGLAVVDTRYGTNIHLAFPGSDQQVEVFDPSPAAARRVVASGRVKSIN